MTLTKPTQIWGNFWQIINICEKLIAEYERVLVHEEVKSQFPWIDTAYIDSIIVHAAKVFSNSKRDSFRLTEFKKICRPEISTQIESIEKEFEEIIGKIITNRNKLIAHLDPKFYELPFSEKQVERWIQECIEIYGMEEQEARSIYAPTQKSGVKTKERYSVIDFNGDLPQIREMFNDLHRVWSQSLPLIKGSTVED